MAFLRIMKRDGWWCYLALDVFLSCVCAQEDDFCIFSCLLFFLVRFFSFALAENQEKKFLLHFSQVKGKKLRRWRSSDLFVVAASAAESWFYRALDSWWRRPRFGDRLIRLNRHSFLPHLNSWPFLKVESHQQHL